MYYYLDQDHNVIPCVDVHEWSSKFVEHMRRVRFDEVDKSQISTVFLGLDHNWGEGPPVVFETMIFSDNADIDSYMARYSTWDEAVKGHELTVQAVKDGVNINQRKTLKLRI